MSWFPPSEMRRFPGTVPLDITVYMFHRYVPYFLPSEVTKSVLFICHEARFVGLFGLIPHPPKAQAHRRCVLRPRSGDRRCLKNVPEACGQSSGKSRASLMEFYSDFIGIWRCKLASWICADVKSGATIDEMTASIFQNKES